MLASRSVNGMAATIAGRLAWPGARAVCQALQSAGHGVYFVGGCVRDACLGRDFTDIDLATDALPDETQAAARAAGLKAVPTGAEHGTITVIADGRGVEVTTFRRDVETDGRHAIVRFSTELADDAWRRDFTMNALYATPDGVVIDPVGGLADLAMRRVRFIGDPSARVAEDVLRILRFFRFHAWYSDPDDGLDADGLAACAAGAAGLDHLPVERIWAELRKLLDAPDPAQAVAAMAQAGILARVLPGATARPLAHLVTLEAAAGRAPDPIRRLSAIGGAAAAGRLRLSRADARQLAQLQSETESMRGLGELAYCLGADRARDVALLRAVAVGAPLPSDTDAAIARGAAATFPLAARDLMPSVTGPALGAALSRLEADWIASDFTLDRDALLARLPDRPT